MSTVREDVREEDLRKDLATLAHLRKSLEALLTNCRCKTGEVLLEVRREGVGLTLTEAAAILGLSRPTVYCLLEDAEAAK